MTRASSSSAPELWDVLGDGPLLYLAPHSDDAALASAGLLHACAAAGLPVRILTCFSRSAHARGGLGSNPCEISAVRKREDRRFVASLPGPVELEWLDLDDAPLRPWHRDKHPCKQTSMTPEDRALAATLAERLAAELDRAALVLGPLGLGRHIDHLIVRDVLAKFAHAGAPVALYEDLPYAGRVTAATLEAEIAAAMAATALDLRPLLLRDPELAARKQAALDCYPSQIVEVHRRGALAQLTRLAAGGPPAERLWLVRRPPPP